MTGDLCTWGFLCSEVVANLGTMLTLCPFPLEADPKYSWTHLDESRDSMWPRSRATLPARLQAGPHAISYKPELPAFGPGSPLLPVHWCVWVAAQTPFVFVSAPGVRAVRA